MIIGAAIPGALVGFMEPNQGQPQRVHDRRPGNYTFPNVTPDTYTIEVVLSGFKTAKRAGVAVSPGDRIVVPAVVLEIGQLQEVVQVKAEAPLVKASSGERSFTVTTDAVQNLPFKAGRSRSLRHWPRASPARRASAIVRRPAAATPTCRWTACRRWIREAIARSSTSTSNRSLK